jgi:LuxR family transcriptional regulator, quorum-sensing system regulator BjaR1
VPEAPSTSLPTFKVLGYPGVATEFFRSLDLFGYTAVLVAELPPPGSRFEKFTLLNGWPQRWYDHYMRERYYDIDQIAIQSRMTVEPFVWSEVAAEAPHNSPTRRIMAEAGEAGLKDGIIVPIYGTSGDQYGVSMAGAEIDARDETVRGIQLVAMYAHHQLQVVAPRFLLSPGKGTGNLSARERECLRWVARGKSDWEIAEILGISIHTAAAHVRASIRKLDSVNRTQAVAKALVSRQIQL